MAVALAADIHRVGRDAQARAGARDVALLLRLRASTQIAEAVARLAFVVGAWQLFPWLPGPVAWCVGVVSLAYYLSVEAQLNHSILHGAYVGLLGAERFTPSRHETMAVPFQCRTWRDAHRIHHANPSVLGADPDTVHPLFRMHETQRWRAWHAVNGLLGALFAFETWAFDYDAFLKRTGHREKSDRREVRKFFLYVGYQFVLFPALSGARWKYVLSGALAAAVMRNLIFTGLQTASSVGHEVSTRHATSAGKKRNDAWYRFQVETSKDFMLGAVARILCGGLDRHIEHHLFPRLPPGRLHEVSGEVRGICMRHGVRYVEYPSFARSVRDSVGYLWRLS